MKLIERQVFVTWYTPDEKLPPDDIFVVITMSGTGPYITYDHALMLAEWDSVEGWIIDGLNADTEKVTVHAWCDLEPYGGGKL